METCISSTNPHYFSIPLRFWINIIKNPEMILDVEKTPIIDSFLSVVAQTYMDACSLSDHRFNPDTPSSKLLYAAELREYKQSVQKFYSDIQVSRTFKLEGQEMYI